MISLLAFFLPLALYWSIPSRMWNFDGVACATALELGNPLYYFHGNHLIFGLLGFFSWECLSVVGISRALPALQLLTSLLSALGTFGIFLTLKSRGTPERTAFWISLALSVTAVVWVWSIEPQVYTLGYLGISWATYSIFRSPSKWKWIGVGFFHGFAILGHIVHVLWIFPACYLLFVQETSVAARKRALFNYFIVMIALVLTAYLVVIRLYVFPFHNAAWTVKWLLGSATLLQHREFGWHSAGLKGIGYWLFTSLRFFLGSLWPYGGVKIGFLGWLSTSLTAALWIGALFLPGRTRAPEVRFALIWLAVYGLFFCFWEPGTECYRLTDAVPLSLLMMHSLQWLQARWRPYWFFALTLSTFLLTLQTRIFRMHDIHFNPIAVETTMLANQVPENSLFLTRGGLAWLYMLYFQGRTTWNVLSFSDALHLQREITRHKRFAHIFVRQDVLDEPSMKKLFSIYRLLPLPYSAWIELL